MLLAGQTTGLFFNNPEAADGYVLFAPNTSDTTYLIDKDGNVVNQWESQYLPGLDQLPAARWQSDSRRVAARPRWQWLYQRRRRRRPAGAVRLGR